MAPVSAQDARELLAGLRGAALLTGYRGAPALNLSALVDALCRVSWLTADCPELAELDLDPVLATAGGAVALDARLRVARSGAGRGGARTRRARVA
ncbi:MAG TPA: acetate--CoA ligase family protein [Vicinamibacterales bacterium]|nr:acetate--CoA ligase family protein [Vicinamibacterales bacterium]